MANGKRIRIVCVIGIELITFLSAYLYFNYLYVNDGILSVSNASQYLPAIIRQSFIINAPIFILLVLAFLIFRKKAAEYFALKVEKKAAKIIVSLLAILYLLSLIRRLFVYDDKVTVLFKWIYYLVFVAFCEELHYRAIIPTIMQGRFGKYVEWLLPNVLFACGHLVIPLVQGKGIPELISILLSSIAGYVLIGMFWEWCKRKSGSLWVGVLMHAIMDFGI